MVCVVQKKGHFRTRLLCNKLTLWRLRCVRASSTNIQGRMLPNLIPFRSTNSPHLASSARVCRSVGRWQSVGLSSVKTKSSCKRVFCRATGLVCVLLGDSCITSLITWIDNFQATPIYLMLATIALSCLTMNRSPSDCVGLATAHSQSFALLVCSFAC